LDGTLALKIIEAIKEDSSCTIEQISARTEIARRTLIRYMDILRKEGRIERIGGKRYGHWQINE
jgi:HTH domain